MTTPIADIPVARIDGSSATLAEHAGKVMLVVNVASKCGLTPQYDGLEALYRTYRERGLVVLGFPANDFGAQEPGSNGEILDFCRSTFGVDFPMYGKITVKGPAKHPLYAALTAAKPAAEFKEGSGLLKRLAGAGTSSEVSWNFEKFLVDRKGNVVRRFAPDTKPDDPVIVTSIESALAGQG